MNECVYMYEYVLHTCGPPGKVQTPEGSHTHTFPQQQANGSHVNVLYSTPACYLWELNKANLTWYLGGLGNLGDWYALWVMPLPSVTLPLQVGETG